MKKRLAVLLMAGILGVSMAACGGGNEEKKIWRLQETRAKAKIRYRLRSVIIHICMRCPVSMQRTMGFTMHLTTRLICTQGAGAERSYCIRGLGSGDHRDRRGCPWVSGVQYESDRVFLRRYAGTGYLGEGG